MAVSCQSSAPQSEEKGFFGRMASRVGWGNDTPPAETAAPSSDLVADTNQGARKPLYRRVTGLFGGGEDKASNPNVKGLELEVKTKPATVKLSETWNMEVKAVVRNTGRRMATLKLPTAQRIEILIRDMATREVVERWSDDRSFAQVESLLVINPGERLEYNESISLRDLEPGRKYELEVSVQGAPGLEHRFQFVPVK
jgi:hypothetical protein